MSCQILKQIHCRNNSKLDELYHNMYLFFEVLQFFLSISNIIFIALINHAIKNADSLIAIIDIFLCLLFSDFSSLNNIRT